MSVLFIVVFFVSQRYYKSENASVDPRVVPARTLYEKYNSFAAEGRYDSVFLLMDTIESIYNGIEHYSQSYELGVLYNNRAAAWITLALHSQLFDSIERDSLILFADKAVRKSLDIYTNWEKWSSKLDEAAVAEIVTDDFMKNMPGENESLLNRYIKTRINEIEDGKEEVKRRMSVSYTNLGIIHRYHSEYDSAALCYQKAIELWDRNLTAENNLNILLGRPLKKRNIIQRLFPPDRL